MKLYKEGNHWKACYDQERRKYYGYLMYTDREGQTRYLYEITKEIFDRLGSFSEDYENDRLIETGRRLFRFENTMYGTMGPEHHVYDENYTESDFDKAFESLKKTRKRRNS